MDPDFEGTWYNQHGSEMLLRVESNGKLTGKYKTKVGAPGDEEEFDLSGFVSDDLIAFTVNFGKYGSLTSWAGQMTEENGADRRIDTLWHLSQNIKDTEEPEKLWASILSGCDVFQRTPYTSKTAKRRRRKERTTSDPYWGPRLQRPEKRGVG